MTDTFELRAILDQLRDELRVLQYRAEDQSFQFVLEDVEVELQVVVTKEGGLSGKVKFEVLGVGVDVGGEGKYAKAKTQKLKLKLTPHNPKTPAEPTKVKSGRRRQHAALKSDTGANDS